MPGFQPKAFVAGRPALRARHLEHEGRARLLHRGGARAAGCGRAAARRRADRRRVRRDREDAVRRRAGRAVPRLRGGLALPRHARRRRRHVPARRADRGQGRARAFGALWLRIRVHGNFIHTAFSEGKRDQNSILRMHEVLERGARVDPDVGERPVERLSRRKGDRQRRRDRGRLRLARLAHAAPHRPLSRRPRAADEADGRRAPRGARLGARRSRSASPTTASRARSTSLRRAPRSTRATSSCGRSTRRTRGLRRAPERDVTRWFSDASALTRYGIPTVNYGTSTGLMDVERREPRDRGLVQTAETYALVAQSVCGVAMKLVTYDDGKVGADRRRRDRAPRRADDARVLRARRGRRHGRADAARRCAAAGADRPEEVLPHGRQLPGARGGVEERRLVARDRAVDRVLPERRRDRRARTSRSSTRSTSPRSSTTSSSSRRASARTASGSAPRRRGLHRRLRDLQRHHRARHPATRDAERRLLASARRSTRSARSGPGSSRPTRSPTRTTSRWSCA